MEAQIHAVDAEIARIEGLFASPDFHRTHATQTNQLTADLAAAKENLAKALCPLGGVGGDQGRGGIGPRSPQIAVIRMLSIRFKPFRKIMPRALSPTSTSRFSTPHPGPLLVCEERRDFILCDDYPR